MGCCCSNKKIMPQDKRSGCMQCGLIYPRGLHLSQVSLHQQLCSFSETIAQAITNAQKITTNSHENQYYWQKEANGHWVRRVGDYDAVEEIVRWMDAEEIASQIFLYRQIWFRLQLERIKIPWQNGSVFLDVHKRDEHYKKEQEYANLMRVDLRRELKVNFVGEKVHDAGGLLRQYIHLLFKEFGLKRCDTQDVFYRLSETMGESDARIMGKIMAKALLERIPIPINLSWTILSQILNRPVSIDMLSTFDEGLYNQLKYMEQNDITDQLTDLGLPETVNEENKMEYIQKRYSKYYKLRIKEQTHNRYKKQIDAILQEIYHIIPPPLLSIFDCSEFELLLSGIPFIDFEDWRINTLYKGEFGPQHKVIEWFWDIVGQMNQEDKQKLLLFCTGSERLPLEGFGYECPLSNQEKTRIESEPDSPIHARVNFSISPQGTYVLQPAGFTTIRLEGGFARAPLNGPKQGSTGGLWRRLMTLLKKQFITSKHNLQYCGHCYRFRSYDWALAWFLRLALQFEVSE